MTAPELEALAVIPQGGRRWNTPAMLADFEIKAELASPETSLERRAELAAERDSRRHGRAAGREQAVQQAARATGRLAGKPGVPS